MSCVGCGAVQAQFRSIRARINPYHFHGDTRRRKAKPKARKGVLKKIHLPQKSSEQSHLENRPSRVALENRRHEAERKARLTVYDGVPVQVLAQKLRASTVFVMDEAARRGIRLKDSAALIPVNVAIRIRRYSRWLAKQRAKERKSR